MPFESCPEIDLRRQFYEPFISLSEWSDEEYQKRLIAKKYIEMNRKTALFKFLPKAFPKRTINWALNSLIKETRMLSSFNQCPNCCDAIHQNQVLAIPLIYLGNLLRASNYHEKMKITEMGCMLANERGGSFYIGIGDENRGKQDVENEKFTGIFEKYPQSKIHPPKIKGFTISKQAFQKTQSLVSEAFSRIKPLGSVKYVLEKVRVIPPKGSEVSVDHDGEAKIVLRVRLLMKKRSRICYLEYLRADIRKLPRYEQCVMIRKRIDTHDIEKEKEIGKTKGEKLRSKVRGRQKKYHNLIQSQFDDLQCDSLVKPAVIKGEDLYQLMHQDYFRFHAERKGNLKKLCALSTQNCQSIDNKRINFLEKFSTEQQIITSTRPSKTYNNSFFIIISSYLKENVIEYAIKTLMEEKFKFKIEKIFQKYQNRSPRVIFHLNTTAKFATITDAIKQKNSENVFNTMIWVEQNVRIKLDKEGIDEKLKEFESAYEIEYGEVGKGDEARQKWKYYERGFERTYMFVNQQDAMFCFCVFENLGVDPRFIATKNVYK